MNVRKNQQKNTDNYPKKINLFQDISLSKAESNSVSSENENNE